MTYSVLYRAADSFRHPLGLIKKGKLGWFNIDFRDDSFNSCVTKPELGWLFVLINYNGTVSFDTRTILTHEKTNRVRPLETSECFTRLTKELMLFKELISWVSLVSKLCQRTFARPKFGRFVGPRLDSAANFYDSIFARLDIIRAT